MAEYDGERSHHASVLSLPHPEVSVAYWSRNKAKTHLQGSHTFSCLALTRISISLYLSRSRRQNLYLLNLGKNNFCSLANQTDSKWIGARIHLQWLSLAVDNGCPAGYWSKGSQSTPSKVRMKGFLVGEFWFEDKGRLVGGRENGQAAKSPHVVYLVLSEDVEVHSDPPPLSPIFHTKMLPDQIYWDKTLTKALVDNELKH